MRRLPILAIISLAAATAAANVFLDALPSNSVTLAGYSDADSVRLRLAEAPLAPVEGMWQMLDDGAVFTLERHTDPSLPTATQTPAYRLVMVKSPSRSIRPGTVIGHAVATAQADVYEAKIYTDFSLEHSLKLPKSFTLHLSADGSSLTFKPRKSKLTVNLFRLLPYMYRHVVRIRENRPDNLDGAIRVYPTNISSRFGPRYL